MCTPLLHVDFKAQSLCDLLLATTELNVPRSQKNYITLQHGQWSPGEQVKTELTVQQS
jgi:hypothetical protein